MTIEIPISRRARSYGYLFWPKASDREMAEILGESATAVVVLDGVTLGEKRVDWKYRRISLGQSKTRSLSPSASRFRVSAAADGSLQVVSTD